MARKSLAASAGLAPAAADAAAPTAQAADAPASAGEPGAPTPAPAEQPAAKKPPVKRAKPAARKASPAVAKPKPVKAVKPAPAGPAAKPVAVDKPRVEVKPAGKLPRPHPKLVRDSFTMPEADFAYIARLKTAALGVGRVAKKSELLRAGLRMLATLDARTLARVLDDLIPVKTGRPKKGR